MSIADLATILAHPWGPGPRPTPTEPFPAPWPDAPRVEGYVDTTPANLGLDGDPVAHALHMLGQLDADQLAEVLAYYQPAPALKAVA